MNAVRVLALLTLSSCSVATSAATFLIDPQFDVSVTSNLVYGTSPNGAGVQLPRLLDIYQPVGPGLPDKLPGVVLMHGGYFIGGSKSGMAGMAEAFARRGYVATSINYRLLNELPSAPGNLPTTDPARYPGWLDDQLDNWGVNLEQYLSAIGAATADQAMAVQWLQDNAASYQVDANRIVVGGFSAGAVSSLLLGYGVVEGAEADVAAVVAFAGGMFGTEAVIESGDPPAFIVHGTFDSVIPFSEYGFLQSALDDAGVKSDAYIVSGGGHTTFFNGASPPLFSFLHANLVPEPSAALFTGVACLASAASRRNRQRRCKPWARSR